MMSNWRMLLGAMTIWAMHFALIWTAASIWGTSTIAKAVAGIGTVLALAALAIIARRIASQPAGDSVDNWFRSLGLTSCAVAALSVVWQAAPAVLL